MKNLPPRPQTGEPKGLKVFAIGFRPFADVRPGLIVKQDNKGPMTLQSVRLDKVREIHCGRVDEGSDSSSWQTKLPSQSVFIELDSADPIEARSIDRLAGFCVD